MKRFLPFNMTACLVLIAVTAGAAHAADQAMSCDGSGFCLAPKQSGKLGMTSRTEIREVAATPPSAEYRRLADETILLRPPVPASTEKNVQTVNPFDSGWHTLAEGEKADLAAKIAAVRSRGITRIEIMGYADKQHPTPETQTRYANNVLLSEARAKETAAFIKTLPEMAAVPMEIKGMGDAEPVVTCDDSQATSSAAAMKAYQACLADNRRVEVLLWYAPVVAAKTQCRNKAAGDQQLPFRISVDGEPIDPLDTSNSADLTRCTDIALEKADIQVRFDGLEVVPVLNITATPEAAVYGESVTFTPYSNYAAFIRKAELRIFAEGDSVQTTPLAVVAMDKDADKPVAWKLPAKSATLSLNYVLRVYDSKGRFDETTPKVLKLMDAHLPMADAQAKTREQLVGYGENHRGLANIPVSGGSITVNGSKLAAGSNVWVMEHAVPVDANGAFAYRQIMPAGDHKVRVVTEAKDGTKAEFSRALYIPTNDWFYVAMGDLTVGKNHVNGPVKLVTGEDSDRTNGDVYADGRAAFYLKGKVKGEWLLTASADTKEQPLQDLFSNFTSKDPRYLLRRIDPNAYYPVYGDDSTMQEDAPTQGKFYVRLEKGDSKVLWGNFQTRLNGSDLVNYSRSLYGANAEYKSEETTKFGERRAEVNGFMADPGSLASLEEFQGTGGSLYYLRSQDLVVGSERVRVEVRDRDSGIVLKTNALVYGQDYEINYIQGRIMLREPLSSINSEAGVVRTGALSGNPAYLVVGYEYVPGVSSVDSLVKGGDASYWLNDYLKLGVTGYNQDTTGAAQTLMGGNATVRYAPGTYLKLEAAKSEGAGDGALSSQNGGFNFNAIPQTTGANIDAKAYRAETGIDIGEILDDGKGKINAYAMKREDGFSSPGQLTNEGIKQAGLAASIPLGEKLLVDAKGDVKEGTTTGSIKSGELAGSYKLTPEETLTLAVRGDDRETALGAGNSNILAETGSRTDGALKLTHAPVAEDGKKAPYEVYALGQLTLDKDDGREFNNRYGAGGRYDITERLSVLGELTEGNGGLGARAGTEYRQSDRTTYYANYLMDNARTDIGYRGRSSNFTTGAKSRYTDSLSVFTEQRYQSYDTGPAGLIHAYGLDLAANDAWNFGGRFENGTLSEPSAGDTDRIAASLNAGYSRDKTKYAGTVEWRNDDNNISGERTSWLMRNAISYQVVEDWRFQGGLNFAISNSEVSSAQDADFTELNLGYAYRPVLNDRLNALLKYTYLSDSASTGQLNASRTAAASGFEQRSHVFALDAIYDLTERFALGGKVGYRFGQLRDTSVANAPWFDSQAWLAVARGDYHIVKEWDLMGELRYLNAREAEDAKFGALVGIYRHLNEHVKLGAGYNFTDFSDDLTNLDYTSQGPFVNLLGTF